MINDPEDLSLHLKYNPATRNLDITATFNNEYDSLTSYFESVYNCSLLAAVVQYVVADSNDIYYEQSKLYDVVETNEFEFNIDKDEGSVLDYRTHHPAFDISYSLAFDSEVIPYFSGYNFFDSNNNFKKGLNIQASIMFYDRSAGYDVTEPFLTLLSNKLYMTPELYSLMTDTNRGIGEGDDRELIPSFINLEELDMNIIKLKAINKIEQKVTVVTPTDSTKKHLLQPVFYQTRNAENLIIHPSVTENISINLDSYKALVSRFKLQIEGVIFNEIGRSGRGVLFKVTGNMLPKNSDNGIAYILDQNNELVTTGKYIYIY